MRSKAREGRYCHTKWRTRGDQEVSQLRILEKEPDSAAGATEDHTAIGEE